MAESAVTYIHDGSFDGVLTAVARAVKASEPAAGIYGEKEYRPTLLERPEPVQTDTAQAQRLFTYLKGQEALAARLAFNGYLSEDREAGNLILGLVRECLRLGERAVNHYTCEPIRRLHKLDKKVGYEAHRLNGLLRFRMLHNGLLYAPVEPDHNVISYCANHFRARLSNRNWILHDIRRDLALYWDCEALQDVTVDKDFTTYVSEHGELPPQELDGQERHYQQLWASFHKAISNPARENPRLQRQLMPKRYWKYLVELE